MTKLRSPAALRKHLDHYRPVLTDCLMERHHISSWEADLMIFAMFRVGALAFYHHDSGWCHGKPDRLTWDVVLRAVQLGLIERMEHSSHYSKLRMVPVEDILNGK